MSIKKQINEMLTRGQGTVEINDITYLTYNRFDDCGFEIDAMTLHFRYIAGTKISLGGRVYLLKERQYDGIINEIERIIKHYLDDCYSQIVRNLRQDIK